MGRAPSVGASPTSSSASSSGSRRRSARWYRTGWSWRIPEILRQTRPHRRQDSARCDDRSHADNWGSVRKRISDIHCPNAPGGRSRALIAGEVGGGHRQTEMASLEVSLQSVGHAGGDNRHTGRHHRALDDHQIRRSRRHPRAAAPRTKCFHVAPSSHWWSKSSTRRSPRPPSPVVRRDDRGSERDESSRPPQQIARRRPKLRNFGVSDP